MNHPVCTGNRLQASGERARGVVRSWAFLLNLLTATATMVRADTPLRIRSVRIEGTWMYGCVCVRLCVRF